MEFSQAPADGKDPVHPQLPRRPQDIKERKRDHLQHDPLTSAGLLFPRIFHVLPPLGICFHASKSPPLLRMC